MLRDMTYNGNNTSHDNGNDTLHHQVGAEDGHGGNSNTRLGGSVAAGSVYAHVDGGWYAR